MVFQNLLYQVEEGIATITLNRPHVLNALSPATLWELKDALLMAEKDDSVGVVVITGAGKAFTAGVDLTSLGDHKFEAGRVGPIVDQPANEAIAIMQNMPKVVIAMVNGYCITGGVELVLGCDLIIASEDARFADTHARVGLRPSWGMTQRLPRLVGPMKAKWMAFTSELISARDAEHIGLVTMVVPADKLVETTRELAKKMLANSREEIAAWKYLCNRGMQQTVEAGLELEKNTEFTFTDTEERLAKYRKKA